MTKRRIHALPRQPWIPAEDAQLAAQYPHMPTKVIAAMLERTASTVYQRAQRLGLAKSPEYLASPAACRLRRGDEVGKAFRFAKGIAPFNKGVKRGRGWAPGRMAEGQFKKGAKPHTWRPVGSIRVNSEGYRDIKIDDKGVGPRAWVAIHRLNWIAANGPVPKGMILRFIDRNPLNTLAENLTLVTREENLRLNWHDRYPRAIKQITQLRGAITRQINKRTRNEQRD